MEIRDTIIHEVVKTPPGEYVIASTLVKESERPVIVLITNVDGFEMLLAGLGAGHIHSVDHATKSAFHGMILQLKATMNQLERARGK